MFLRIQNHAFDGVALQGANHFPRMGAEIVGDDPFSSSRRQSAPRGRIGAPARSLKHLSEETSLNPGMVVRLLPGPSRVRTPLHTRLSRRPNVPLAVGSTLGILGWVDGQYEIDQSGESPVECFPAKDGVSGCPVRADFVDPRRKELLEMIRAGGDRKADMFGHLAAAVEFPVGEQSHDL